MDTAPRDIIELLFIYLLVDLLPNWMINTLFDPWLTLKQINQLGSLGQIRVHLRRMSLINKNSHRQLERIRQYIRENSYTESNTDFYFHSPNVIHTPRDVLQYRPNITLKKLKACVKLVGCKPYTITSKNDQFGCRYSFHNYDNCPQYYQVFYRGRLEWEIYRDKIIKYREDLSIAGCYYIEPIHEKDWTLPFYLPDYKIVDVVETGMRNFKDIISDKYVSLNNKNVSDNVELPASDVDLNVEHQFSTAGPVISVNVIEFFSNHPFDNQCKPKLRSKYECCNEELETYDIDGVLTAKRHLNINMGNIVITHYR